jgi:hypothetical protein
MENLLRLEGESHISPIFPSTNSAPSINTQFLRKTETPKENSEDDVALTKDRKRYLLSIIDDFYSSDTTEVSSGISFFLCFIHWFDFSLHISFLVFSSTFIKPYLISVHSFILLSFLVSFPSNPNQK